MRKKTCDNCGKVWFCEPRTDKSCDGIALCFCLECLKINPLLSMERKIEIFGDCFPQLKTKARERVVFT